MRKLWAWFNSFMTPTLWIILVCVLGTLFVWGITLLIMVDRAGRPLEGPGAGEPIPGIQEQREAFEKAQREERNRMLKKAQ